MNIIRKAIYLIVLVLIANLRLSAQNLVYYSNEEAEKYITAYTSNHYPELNEPVTITLKANITEKYLKRLETKSSRSGIFFGIQPDAGVEIISGKTKYDKPIEKVGTIEMKLTVKFTKIKYVRITAVITHGFMTHRAYLPFYVGGAYYESKEVKGIKSLIKKMRKGIENGKTRGIYVYKTKRGIRTVAPDIGKNHTFEIFKEVLLKTKDKALEWNMQKYEELRKEYDALAYVIETIRYNSTRKHRRSNPNEKSYRSFLKEYNTIYNKDGSDTNKYIKKYKELLEENDPMPSSSGCSLNKGTSTKGTLRSNDATAIKTSDNPN